MIENYIGKDAAEYSEYMQPERMVSAGETDEDHDIDSSLRPKHLDDYIGQAKVKENLKIYIEAARQRGDSLDHVLLYALPGSEKRLLPE